MIKLGCLLFSRHAGGLACRRASVRGPGVRPVLAQPEHGASTVRHGRAQPPRLGPPHLQGQED